MLKADTKNIPYGMIFVSGIFTDTASWFDWRKKKALKMREAQEDFYLLNRYYKHIERHCAEM